MPRKTSAAIAGMLVAGIVGTASITGVPVSREFEPVADWIELHKFDIQ